MEIKTCKFCGAPIVWLKTQNGRPMYDKVNSYAVFENLYKGYQMTDIKKKTSEYTTGAYVYVKMKRKE